MSALGLGWLREMLVGHRGALLALTCRELCQWLVS